MIYLIKYTSKFRSLFIARQRSSAYGLLGSSLVLSFDLFVAMEVTLAIA